MRAPAFLRHGMPGAAPWRPQICRNRRQALQSRSLARSRPHSSRRLTSALRFLGRHLDKGASQIAVDATAGFDQLSDRELGNVFRASVPVLCHHCLGQIARFEFLLSLALRYQLKHVFRNCLYRKLSHISSPFQSAGTDSTRTHGFTVYELFCLLLINMPAPASGSEPASKPDFSSSAVTRSTDHSALLPFVTRRARRASATSGATLAPTESKSSCSINIPPAFSWLAARQTTFSHSSRDAEPSSPEMITASKLCAG